MEAVAASTSVIWKTSVRKMMTILVVWLATSGLMMVDSQRPVQLETTMLLKD
jgi:hypothetical protein